MSDAILALVICAVATLTNLSVQLLAYRRTQRYMRAVFAGFSTGLLVLACSEAVRFLTTPASPLEGAVLLLGDVIIYICTAFGWWNFVNAGESSIRIRILRELRAAKGPLLETDLMARYNERIILETRLARMVGNRQADCIEGRYRVTSATLVRPAKTFRFLKRILLQRTSEFDGVE